LLKPLDGALSDYRGQPSQKGLARPVSGSQRMHAEKGVLHHPLGLLVRLTVMLRETADHRRHRPEQSTEGSAIAVLRRHHQRRP
jgi:hypothetical protein